MDKNVLVTGASGGLGFALAKLHLSAGDTVWACIHKNGSQKFADLAKSSRLHIVQMDMSSMKSVRAALQSICGIDILYNCAAVYRFEARVPLEETDLDEYIDMMNINVFGPLRVIGVCLSRLKHDCAIINVSSEAGSIGACWRDSEYAYCMSKAALNMGSRILQNYFDEKNLNLRVVCVQPGWLKTAIGGPDAETDPEDSAKDLMAIAADMKNIPKNHMFLHHSYGSTHRIDQRLLRIYPW